MNAGIMARGNERRAAENRKDSWESKQKKKTTIILKKVQIMSSTIFQETWN